MSGSAALTKSPSQIRRHHSTFCSLPSLSHVKTSTVLSAPLLPNILPHFEALLNFVTNTLPKPVLIALLYRLTILHLASRILPTIGANSWESEDGVDDGWDGRPVGL